MDIRELEPKRVYHYFQEICKIPHGSKNTKALSDYLYRFAKEKNLKARQDECGNITIWKKASEGRENEDPVIFQGHMDMVCEKTPESNIDFEKDALELYVDGDYVKAKDTTLGGDDGIAVAFALAILEDDTISSPELIVIITVGEEIGMLGADAYDCTDINAKYLLNFDSEDEGILVAGCAGGCVCEISIPVKKETVSGIRVDVKIEGCSGGHSGVEIDKDRINANIALGRVLDKLKQEYKINILDINGGKKDNAIPRESKAEIIVGLNEELTDDMLGKNLIKFFKVENSVLKQENIANDPLASIMFDIKASSTECIAYDFDTTEKIIEALLVIPNGIQRMSPDIEGFVQTSLNLGILSSEDDSVKYSYCVRSSVDSEKQYLVNRLFACAKLLGASMKVEGAYPAWEYNRDSKLCIKMKDLYKEMFEEDAKIETIHAGVECGLFTSKIKGLDAVSFGPNLFDIHTTSERMSIKSVSRMWDYVIKLLEIL